MGSRRQRLLNPSTHSSVAYSAVSKLRHGPPAVDDLCCKQTVDRLGQRVVITVTDAANREFDACFCDALRVADG